jgi:membrane-bound lytic murein transglycosylase D
VPTPVSPLAASLKRRPESPSTSSIASDRINQLLRKVKATYAAGQQAYQTGNLEEAKRKYDQALAILLESRYDIRSHERLYNEFEKLVHDTYEIELATVESGNSLSAHEYEPSPLDTFGRLTFPVNPNIRLRAQEEMRSLHSDLPLVSNDAVDGYLSYFQGPGRDFIQKVLRREGRYAPTIRKALAQEGLPQDLIYLAAGESAFNPFAVSRAGARGIWQFMLGTARLNGLVCNRWVDERQDPVLSSEAAARHLKDLYEEFGDWYLAMAAYDCGSLTVQRAIERTGYADFWKLRELHVLPPETENYVPIFLAIALICKDPQAYGFNVTPDPPLRADRVVTPVPTDLRLVADIVGCPVNEIIQLNPSLLRWTTPVDDPNFVLNLPRGTEEEYEKVIGSIPPSKRIWWRVMRVREGQTLPQIAAQYHITTASLIRANHIAPDDPIETGDMLVLPLAAWRESLSRRIEGGPRRLTWYRIRPGDTLYAIADRFDVTAYEIRRWNGLRSSRILAGHLLRLYPIRRVEIRYHRLRGLAAGLHFYRIRPGDNLYGIAIEFGVTVAQIRRWNDLQGSTIVAGRMLKIYVAPRTASSSAAANLPAAGPLGLIQYHIRPGDTLSAIADRFDVTAEQLRIWNGLRGSRIIVGKILRIYRTSRTTLASR